MDRRSRRDVRAGLVLVVLCSGLGSWSAGAQGRSPAARPELRLDGRAIQGGLVVGHADPGSRVTLQGRRIRVSPAGTFLVGFAMDAPSVMALEVVLPDGSRADRTFQIEQRQYATERIDGLPEDEVDLDRYDRTSERRAHRRIEQLRRRFRPEAAFTTSGFEWPARGRVSTPFGVGRVLNGEARAGHDAIDIAVSAGTVVHAPASGIVVFTSLDLPLSGRMMIVDHGMGVTSTFLHLREIRVRVGDRVEQGATLGLSGDTGRTTGAHLHWGLHLLGVALDAELLVTPVAAQPAPALTR